MLLLSGAARARDRSFLFTYAVTITHLPQDKLARLWMPMPQSSVDQQIQIVSEDLPAEPKIATESKCGNRIAYIESHPRADGTLPIRVVYRVTRHEIGEDDPSVISSGEPYLQPDALVPVGGKPQALLANHPLPSDQLKLARVLYDLVDDHMQYRKDQPGWGRGDACWAADSGFGNCTDFHSLFISLARTRGIPCKFEIGFPIPATRGKGDVSGYHCWVKFKPIGRGWIPADISEAKLNPSRRDYFFGHLDENRVAFSEGRDLTLVPKQQGPAINFFVYPYVEVDRKPFAAQNVEKHFSYQDLSAEKM